MAIIRMKQPKLFLLFLLFFFLPIYPLEIPPFKDSSGPLEVGKVQAAFDHYTIDNSTDDVMFEPESADWPKEALFKWDVSSIPTNGTVVEAYARMSQYSLGTWDWYFALVFNQTWVEGTGGAWHNTTHLSEMTYSTEVERDQIIDIGWQNWDLTSLFELNRGNANFTIRICGESGSSPTHVANGTKTRSMYAASHDYAEAAPYSGVYLRYNTSESITPPELHVSIDSGIKSSSINVIETIPSGPNTTTSATLEYMLDVDGKTELQKLAIDIGTDGTNITIAELPLFYTFFSVFPNASYTDEISSKGNFTLTSLAPRMYTIFFQTGDTKHTLHIAMYAPDGVGLMWEVFPVYLNNTRTPYPPSHELFAGYYEYEVQDYFSQTVLSGNFTIASTDLEDVYQNWELPLYKVSFHNGDLAPYRIEITRNAITREYPAPPKGDVEARLYGIAANVPYTVEIYQAESGEFIAEFTLNVPNAPLAQPLDYDNDEEIYFPTYDDQFELVVDTMVYIATGINKILLLGFIGLIAVVIVQRFALLRGIFRKPLVPERKRR